MDVGTLVFAGAAVLAGVYGVLIYNNLVTLKHGIAMAWANIDVLLKQRHDELPKLVETCRQHMQYEQQTLERVVRARAAVSSALDRADVEALGAAESGLRASLAHLFAVAEAYPELRANETFQHLQGRITGLENGIADRRELYNESVTASNVRVEQFPDLLVARLFGFPQRPLLEFEAEDMRDADLRPLFG